jgi:hypothetical protein
MCSLAARFDNLLVAATSLSVPAHPVRLLFRRNCIGDQE